MDEQNELPKGYDVTRVNLNPPTMDEVKHAIKAWAMVLGQTKTVILEKIKEEWLYGYDDAIKIANHFTWELFAGREKMPRKTVRAGRTENKLKFSDIVRKKLR